VSEQPNPERLTPAEVAARLNLGAAMLRRYASALETVQGHPLPRGAKGERLFSGEHVAALERSRLMVRDNPGVSVEAAMGVVLGHREVPAGLTVQAPAYGDPAPLLEALRTMSGEMAALRNEVERLRAEVERRDALPAPDSGQALREAVRAELGQWEAATGSDDAVRAAVAPVLEELAQVRAELARERAERLAGEGVPPGVVPGQVEQVSRQWVLHEPRPTLVSRLRGWLGRRR